MISRRTLFSLVLGLLVLLGIRAFRVGHLDGCDRFLAGDTSFTATEYVPMGSRIVEVPCRLWFLRQPMGVQAACLLEAAVAVVFLLSVARDVVAWRRRRAEGGRARWRRSV